MRASAENDDLIKRMTNEVIDEIGTELERQILNLGPHTEDISKIVDKAKDRKNKTEKTAKIPKMDLESLQQMKHSKQVQIKQIERCQSILKRSTMMNNSAISKSFSKLQISRFTPDQMATIKEIMKKQRQFAKSLKQKEKNLEEWIQEKRLEDQELKKKEITEKCQIRRAEIRAKIDQLQKKKQVRKEQLEEDIVKLKELKQKKWLYQKLEEMSAQHFKKGDEEDLKKFQVEKQRRKQAVANIEIHRMQYQEKKKSLQKQRQKRVLEESRAMSKTELPSLHSSIWNKLKQYQEEDAKMSQWEKAMKQNNISKKKVYSKNVKELFFPKLTNKTNKLQIKEEPDLKRKALKLSEEQELGNNYMRSAHENITSGHIQKVKKKEQEMNVQAEGGYSAYYKNYLKDLKEGHKSLQSHQANSRGMKKLLEDPTKTQAQKLKKAMELLVEKDRKIKRNRDSEIVDSIKSKLLVLKQLIR